MVIISKMFQSVLNFHEHSSLDGIDVQNKRRFGVYSNIVEDSKRGLHSKNGKKD